MAKRRANGEGTCRQRSDGSWEGRVVVEFDENGKPKTKSYYGRSQRDVLDKMAKQRTETLAGISADAGRTTVAEYLDRWIEDCVRLETRPNTCSLYRRTVKLYLKPHIGGILLSKLSPVHVQGLLSTLDRDGKSPRLRQVARAVLHRALGQAMRQNLIPRNPCDAVRMPRAPKKEIAVLSIEEAKKFLGAADDRLNALYVLAITTGLRQGELLGLQWEDLDLKAKTLLVRRQLLEESGKIRLGELKTDASRRRVDLPAIAVEALRAHQKAAGQGAQAGALVFTDTEGNPIRKSNLIRRWFHPSQDRAGIPRTSFHALRHTAASLLLTTGAHPKVVQERLGHSRIGTTMDTYSHLAPGLQRQAAAKLDKLLAPKAERAAKSSGKPGSKVSAKVGKAGTTNPSGNKGTATKAQPMGPKQEGMNRPSSRGKHPQGKAQQASEPNSGKKVVK